MIAYFRTAHAVGGICKWRAEGKHLTAEHTPSFVQDPRERGRVVNYTIEFKGEQAHVRLPDREEIWRRLSGGGVSPMAGAWTSGGLREEWLYLTSAGHYAVMRESSRRSLPAHDEVLSDEEVLSLAHGFSFNAGARLETRASFDHWPMVSMTNPGAIDCRKHETFCIADLSRDCFVAGFQGEGIEAEEWRRLG